ncbi:hypothetical protein BGX20_005461, partial [Mortierella sp. AD010]
MCEDDKAKLQELIPEEAIQELFFRLRGRFRPIISTIEEIITKGCTSYWKEAIKQRLQSMTSYPEHFPVRGNLCSDIKRMLDKVTKDPVKYKEVIDIRHVLRQTVVCRASLGLPWSLKGEEPIMVESAFARLRVATDQAAIGGTVETVIDEPFVFRAAYNFIKNEDNGFYNLFREQYRSLQEPSPEGIIFERHAPLDLIYAFHNKQLQHELFSVPKAATHREKPKIPIPDFEPVTFPKHLFEHKATIVGWEGYEWGTRHSKTLTMHDFMEAHYWNYSRNGDYKVPPFYYPGLSPSGPDIVFVLQINNELYPVFVQTKLLKGIFPVDVENARLTVHESRIKHYLPNLARYCPNGKYLSLLYVHPTINKKPRTGWKDDSLWDSEPKTRANDSSSSMDAVKPLMQLLMIIDGSNMGNFVPRGVVDLLSRTGQTRIYE